MRTTIGTLSLLLLVCIAGGCKKEQPPRKEDLQARLQSAMQINSIKDKDEALNTVALDASDAGFGDIAKQAVNAMNALSLRDQAASDSALKLARNHQLGSAKDLAQTINSIELRDKTLKKLAEGSQ